jgi:hypothetical protein
MRITIPAAPPTTAPASTKPGAKAEAAPPTRSLNVFVVDPSLQFKGDSFSGEAATGPLTALGQPPVLTNHGGAVLTSPVLSNIYVGDYWNTTKGQADRTQNDAAAVDFGQSKLMDVAAQYGAGPTTFDSSTVVSGASPATFTDADAQQAVKDALAQGSINKNAQGIYTIVLPPKTVLDLGGGADSKNGLGGYHGSFDDGTGKPVYYSVIAYSDTAGNGINFDGNSQHALNITESHEWMETITDPDNGSTIPGRGVAWADDSNGAEIGDEMMPDQLNQGLPITKSFEKDAGGFNQQLEWSNDDQLFEIDTPAKPPAAPAPAPPKKG